MNHNVLVAVIILVAVIVIVAINTTLYRKQRRRRLREHFGVEYDRAVLQRGSPTKAEIELINREKRVHHFAIKALPPATRDRYEQEWAAVQRRFVDDPALAVTEADALVNRVMIARGYPMADFEQRAADISVTYPDVVQNYRSARVIVVRHGRGDAGTEDLRQAMVHYRSLFDELLDLPKSAAASSEFIHKRAS